MVHLYFRFLYISRMENCEWRALRLFLFDWLFVKLERHCLYFQRVVDLLFDRAGLRHLFLFALYCHLFDRQLYLPVDLCRQRLLRLLLTEIIARLVELHSRRSVLTMHFDLQVLSAASSLCFINVLKHLDSVTFLLLLHRIIQFVSIHFYRVCAGNRVFARFE